MNQVRQYVTTVRNLAQKQRSVKQASVLKKLANNNYLVSILKSSHNINENTTHTYQDLYELTPQGFNQLSQGDCTLSNCQSSYSIDRQTHIKLQQLSDETEKKKYVLEVYKEQSLHSSINLSKFHDEVINNEMVGQPFQWNKTQDKVLYVAKLKPKDTKTFFQLGEQDEIDKAWGYRKYEQSWGERMDNIYETGLFMYDLTQCKVYQISIGDSIFVAHPQFDQNDGLVFTGYQESPEFKYGIVHCFNRPSKVYQIAQPILIDMTDKKDAKQEVQHSKLQVLSDDAVSIKPQISPDYQQLVYFGCPLNHQHLSYLALKHVNLNNNVVTELIAIPQDNLVVQVRDQPNERDSLFLGICGYYDDLSQTYWTKDSKVFIFPTKVAAQSLIYAVNIESKQIHRLTHLTQQHATHNCSAINYDAINDTLFYTDESVAQPPQLCAITDLNQTILTNKPLKDVTICENTNIKPELNNFKESYVYSGQAEGFIWQLEQEGLEQGERPLAVLLHGGPHGAVQSTYTILRHILLQQGYIILAPNFTGSASYGQQFIEKLSGNIGQLDAEEIVDMIQQVKQQYKTGNAFVMGGSYGGYMSNIMASQYSHLFKCAIILNPVTNLPFMFNISDIPEWASSCALNMQNTWNLTPDNYKTLFEHSPMKSHIKIPTLLFLGQKDRRCPYQQGLALRAQTLANGVPIQTYVYPEADHSLSDSLNTSFDVLIKAITFANEKINK